MLGQLQRSGFDIVDDHEASDAIIINTCAFVEDAKSESLNTILEASCLRDARAGKRLIVTGCMAQRYAGELAESLPEIDGLVGFERYGELPQVLRDALSAQPYSRPDPEDLASVGVRAAPAHVRVGEPTIPFRPEWDRVRLTLPHTAYLRVAEGCSHACSFCAIPGFRGKFRSKPWASVVDEARRLVADGVKELVLIAEDTNQYGMDRCACRAALTSRTP
jgi:ribosomal protein S12 methylthiotransferase